MSSYAFVSGFACHDCGVDGGCGECGLSGSFVDEGLRAPWLVDAGKYLWQTSTNTAHIPSSFPK